MSGPKIHFPTKEENNEALKEFFVRQRIANQERLEAAKLALPALDRLCVVMRERSGQPYKVRALLYSLWNGKPADLSDTLNLDWEIKQDLCKVILAFGFESKDIRFFYDALESAVTKAGQFDWFLEERFAVSKMRDYVESVDREKKGES